MIWPEFFERPFVNENPVVLQATGFIVDPSGEIITAVYSTRAIGRLMPGDVLNFVRHFKKLAAAAQGGREAPSAQRQIRT